MSKTDTTKRLESLLKNHFVVGQHYAFEVTYGWLGHEIVDCVMYDCKRDFYCFEIKQSVSDFHSKAKISFLGNFNYYVMPKKIYEKVKDEIPANVGCYVPVKQLNEEILACAKKAKRVKETCDREVMLASMLRSSNNSTTMRATLNYMNDKYLKDVYKLRDIVCADKCCEHSYDCFDSCKFWNKCKEIAIALEGKYDE